MQLCPAPGATAPSCVRQDPRCRQHPPRAAAPQMQPLGNAVDEQINHCELRQIAAGKRLVLGPQPLGDLADRRAAQQAADIRTGKHRLNVARRQPAGIHLHRQALQLFGASPLNFPNARAEWLLPIGDLRRTVLDGAPSALGTRPRR